MSSRAGNPLLRTGACQPWDNAALDRASSFNERQAIAPASSCALGEPLMQLVLIPFDGDSWLLQLRTARKIRILRNGKHATGNVKLENHSD